jgi:hypothetical protein
VDAVARRACYVHPIEAGAELLDETQARRDESILADACDERNEHFATTRNLRDLGLRAFEDLVFPKVFAQQLDDLRGTSHTDADSHGSLS